MAIDLGTDFSEVSHTSDSGVVEVFANSDGDLKTPSIVSIANGQPIVGKGALPDLVLNPQFVIKRSKRYMGKVTENNNPIPILTDPAGREWTPVDCATEILIYLKKCAEDYLGYEVEDAVITVLAYFDAIARIHTKEAARKA